MKASVLVVTSTLLGALLMWLLSILGTTNLRTGKQWLAQAVLVVAASLIGIAAGSVMARHRNDENPVLFGATAGALSGAICGATYSVVMGIAFVTTFGGAPVSAIDAIVVVVAFPVFAVLGALVGSLPGLIIGCALGYMVLKSTSADPVLLENNR